MTKAQIKRRVLKCFAVFKRIGLHNRNFSLISNNCWGGHIYDLYGLQYKTPTIGLWIPPKDYIKFLSNLEFYLKQNLIQISYDQSHVSELLVKRKNEGRYDFDLKDLIVGRLFDVDIIFTHYSSFEDALSKWNKRVHRINFDNLVVKMNDQNECQKEDCEAFLALPFKNKLFFTSNIEWASKKGVCFIQKYSNYGYVVSDTNTRDVPINVKKYLNSLVRNR